MAYGPRVFLETDRGKTPLEKAQTSGCVGTLGNKALLENVVTTLDSQSRFSRGYIHPRSKKLQKTSDQAYEWPRKELPKTSDQAHEFTVNHAPTCL